MASAAATCCSALFYWSGLLDLCVCVALCYLAAMQVQAAAFTGIVIGIVEFCAGALVCIVAIAGTHASWFADHFRFLMRYWGRGLVFVLFGCIGLGGPVQTYVLALIIIAIGFGYMLLACLAPGRLPRPLCGCGEPKETSGTAQAHAAAADKSSAPRARYDPRNPFRPAEPKDLAGVAAAASPAPPVGGHNPFK